jgi:hypothetical protein
MLRNGKNDSIVVSALRARANLGKLLCRVAEEAPLACHRKARHAEGGAVEHPGAFSALLEQYQGNHVPRIHQDRRPALSCVAACCSEDTIGEVKRLAEGWASGRLLFSPAL